MLLRFSAWRHKTHFGEFHTSYFIPLHIFISKKNWRIKKLILPRKRDDKYVLALLKPNEKEIESLKSQGSRLRKNQEIRILIKIFTNINYLRASNMKLLKLVALFFSIDWCRAFFFRGWIAWIDIRSAIPRKKNISKIRFPFDVQRRYKCRVKAMRRKEVIASKLIPYLFTMDHQREIMCKMWY